MTERLVVKFEHGLQDSAAMRKSFFESLPYFLGGDYEVSITDDGLAVEDVSEPLQPEISKAVVEAYRRVEADHERVQERLLHEFNGPFPVQAGVYETLQQQGWITPTGLGKVTYSGLVARVFNALDTFLLNLCKAHGAHSEIYPVALEGKSLFRARYFDTFAQHAYFVTPLRTTLAAITAARDGSVIEPDATENEHLQVPEWVLSPTVCHHCFETLKDSSLDASFKVTAVNQCARYEVHGTRSMERLRLYWMREFIHFNPDAKEISESLDNVLNDTIDFLTRWGISHQVVTASDPFFSDSGTAKRMFQNTFALKRELKLPFASGSIACASFNNHQESLARSFAITSGPGKPNMHSCCVGWGYDRLLLCLFTQLGCNPDQWPDAVRQDLKL